MDPKHSFLIAQVLSFVKHNTDRSLLSKVKDPTF